MWEFQFSGFPQAVGVSGVVIYLASYFALQIRLIPGHGFIYPLMNMLAASCVLFSLMTEFNLASLLTQISFILISLVGMCRSLMSRRKCNFSAEERHFLNRNLPTLKGSQARKFLNAGTWATRQTGEVLSTEGGSGNELIYLAEGSAVAGIDGHVLHRYEAPCLVGELTCLNNAPAVTTVRVEDAARCFTVTSEQLQLLCDKDPDMRQILETSFAREGRRKMLTKYRTLKSIAESGTGNILTFRPTASSIAIPARRTNVQAL